MSASGPSGTLSHKHTGPTRCAAREHISSRLQRCIATTTFCLYSVPVVCAAVYVPLSAAADLVSMSARVSSPCSLFLADVELFVTRKLSADVPVCSNTKQECRSRLIGRKWPSTQRMALCCPTSATPGIATSMFSPIEPSECPPGRWFLPSWQQMLLYSDPCTSRPFSLGLTC